MDAISVAQLVLDFALRYRKRLRARAVLDVPRLLIPGNVYVVGEPDDEWAAVFRCPCGCRETIQLSLVCGRRPLWHMTVGPRDWVTLRPSVWRRVGCRSHFWVEGGRVTWAGS